MTKKILGFVFILIAAILFIAIIGQLPKLLATIFLFFEIFTGELDARQVGNIIGMLVYWVLHFGITISLWSLGRRWIRPKIALE